MPGFDPVLTGESANAGRVKWNAMHEETFERFNTFENVSSEAAMLALDAKQGDVAIRTDLNPDTAYRLKAEPATTLSNWVQISVLATDTSALGDDVAILQARFNTFENVASQSAMLALSAKKGDVAIRTDLNPDRTYKLKAEPASTLSNWVVIGIPEVSGVTDHGDLTGLSDDDHSQYALTTGTRLRVYRSTTAPTGPSAGQMWLDTNSSPALLKEYDGSTWQTTGYALASHNHNASEINAGTMATARLGSGSASSSTFLRGDSTWAAPGGSSGLSPAWMDQTSGALYAAWGGGDPTWFYPMFYQSTFLQTTNAGLCSTTVNRMRKFRLPKALSVSHVRFLGEGTTTGVWVFGIYPVGSATSRVWQATINTAAGFNDITSGTPFSLSANTDYWFAVGVTTTSSATAAFYVPAAPVRDVFSGGTSAIAGKSIGMAEEAQFATTAGAMPSTLPTVDAVSAAWARSIPFVFLEGTAS